MGQNRQELFICISLCIAKMLTISPYFWTSESPYFSFHRVGSPATALLGDRLSCILFQTTLYAEKSNVLD